MNLIEALEILREPTSDDAHRLRIFLACGFLPLHFKTFLAAHLRKARPAQAVEIEAGVFGDLAGNLERAESARFEALAVAIEWADLDARLGIRNLGGWRIADLADILESSKRQLLRLENSIRRTSGSLPVVVSLPTLPLPPLSPEHTTQSGASGLRLRESAASFATSISSLAGVRVVNSQRVDEESPLSGRFDVKSEVMAGFPYTLSHASIMAELFATVIRNRAPKKGLITDLDDTLWAGILGDLGIEGISWDLEGRAQMHGVYQQFLASLASAGVLIAVASKNDPLLVEQAFGRTDLLLSKENVFPLEVHWSRKSESVQRILKKWNVGAEAVVFIDDSVMETAEVKASFPEMECIVFPRNDYPAIWKLLRHLRDVFGKDGISDEDSIRLQSIRNASAIEESLSSTGVSADDFLRSAGASISIGFVKNGEDRRALELINKTNQFNLNGKRVSDSEWMDHLRGPDTFVMTVNYEDKFGPLGKIAVLAGRRQGKNVKVHSWVMSCRAFSRRIEHQSLRCLFERLEADEIAFDYQPTARNGPLQEFFLQFMDGPLDSNLRLSKKKFWERAPALFHHVHEATNG